MDPNSNPSTQPADLPGTVVMPTPPPAAPEPALPVPPPPVAPVPTPVPEPQPEPTPASVAEEAPEEPVADAEPDEQPEVAPDNTSTEDQSRSTEPVFSWQASEYIHHAKGVGWYFAFAVILVVLMAVAYFTHEWLGGAVFAVMAIAVVVYARKAPRTLTYALSDDGITIESHHYPFTQFRTFAVLPDIAWHTIDLEPTQRLMPRLTILFEDSDVDAIVNHLADHLPRVDRQPDLVERATRYLRF